jgi:predicted secreted protein
MTKNAGYKTKVYVSDDNSTYEQVDATEATISTTAEVIDVTTLGGTGWREKIIGLKDWTLNLPSLWDSGDNALALVRAAFLAGTALYVRFDIDGTSSNRLSGQVLVESVEFGASLSEASTATPSLTGTGALTITLAS